MFQIKIVKDELCEGVTVHSRTAVRAIIRDGAKILMVETNRGDFIFPGGGVEEGESFAEALRREIQEETGYEDVAIGPCIGTAFEQNEDDVEQGAIFQMKSYYYVCRLKSEKRTEGILDDYEEKLGFKAIFADVKNVYEKNSVLLLQGRDTELPWLSRETQVLERLAFSDLDQIALEVYECGQIIRDADRSKLLVEEKEGHANFVTSYDRRIQEELYRRLQKLHPLAAFVGEEEDTHVSVGLGEVFIVDPIDGTTNFMKDYHCSCISVGVAQDGVRSKGIVYNPYLNEMFTAECGHGAYKNGEQIFVSAQPLERGLVLFGTAPYNEELAECSFRMAYEYFKKAMDVRRSGSAAIDLCNIACGRAELYFELRLSPWDFAAGSLMVEEAGGRVSTVEGMPLTLDAPCSLKATNGIAEFKENMS